MRLLQLCHLLGPSLRSRLFSIADCYISAWLDHSVFNLSMSNPWSHKAAACRRTQIDIPWTSRLRPAFWEAKGNQRLIKGVSLAALFADVYACRIDMVFFHHRRHNQKCTNITPILDGTHICDSLSLSRWNLCTSECWDRFVASPSHRRSSDQKVSYSETREPCESYFAGSLQAWSTSATGMISCWPSRKRVWTWVADGCWWLLTVADVHWATYCNSWQLMAIYCNFISCLCRLMPFVLRSPRQCSQRDASVSASQVSRLSAQFFPQT